MVETTNFREGLDEHGMGNTIVGGSRNMRLVERFRRVDANTIDYRFTVTDPEVYTKPWTASAPMTKLDGHVYGIACHEGNYSMVNSLSGARAEEQAELKDRKK